MSDEDRAFAEIVKQEFDEQWVPAPAPVPDPPQVRPAQPLPDFQLNLFDDDESYRDVPKQNLSFSAVTWWGVGLILAGLLITIGRMSPLRLPLWTGWIAVGCFVAGAVLCLWHLTHAGHIDEDPDGTV